jgi:hypothetical protein
MSYGVPQGVQHFLDLMLHTNTMTGGYEGSLVVLTIFSITFISLKGYTFGRALLTSSFITAIAAMLMSVAGFVPMAVVAIPFVLVVAGVFVTIFE